MTFDPTKPNSGESPSVAPAQIQTNWSRLEAIIDADHQFNDSSANNDGYHNRVSLLNNAVASLPTDSNAVMYSKNDGLGTGTSRDEIFTRNASLECPVALRAFVMFDGRNSDGACTLNCAFGVSGVSRSGGTGLYTVTFTALPTAKYVVSCVAQSGASNTVRILQPLRGATYTVAQTTTTLKLQCYDRTGELKDFTSAHVMIFGG